MALTRWRASAWPPIAVDAGAAAALAAAGQVSVWAFPGANAHPIGWVAAIEAVAASSLAWRRRAPAASLAVATVATAAFAAVTGTSPSIFFLIVVLAAAYAAGAHGAPRRGLPTVAAGILVAEAISVIAPDGESVTDAVLSAPVLVGLPWLAGRAARRARGQSEQLTALTEQLRAERDERAREAVAAERVRIARDLHDVIAHSVSVMIVQAGAAEQVLDADPARARAPLHAIRATGKAALEDMRRLLGVLRTDEPLSLEPQPTISDLEGLARRFAAAGLPVDVAIDRGDAALAPGVELTAYRVCQEALTNSLKHGGGSASLTVSRRPDAVSIAIVDDGGGRPVDGQRGGHGLAGMRERVALYGGDLDARARPEGGFAVTARLPCAPPAP